MTTVLVDNGKSPDEPYYGMDWLRAFSGKHHEQGPSLHFKKVGRFWSARVGSYHRALAVEAA